MPGSIAALTMGWQRRMGGSAGPLSASGEASNGDPVQVELLVNGVWVDITPYVMVRDDSGNISITRGQRDEGSQSEQATASFLLDNRDGRFSPRNPVGAYYGLIGRNQPLRISVPNGLGGKAYRFWGEISVWPQFWDPTGSDVWTEISANGIIRRLSQGPAPEHSVIYNALTDPIDASVMAYWPCEDAAESLVIASALTNGSAMTFSGTPTLASYEGFKASDPLPDISECSLSGGVTKYTDPTATQVRFLLSMPSDGLTEGKVICAIDQENYAAGRAQFWELIYASSSNPLALPANTLYLRQCDADALTIGIELSNTTDVRGRQMYISVEMEENGTGINRALRITDVDSGVVYSATDVANLTALTRVTRVQMGPTSRSGSGGTRGLPTCAVGHVSVQNTITSVTALGVRLNTKGETAGRRVQRLCSEEAIPFQSLGDLDDTARLGDQTKLNPLSVMQEGELADTGILYETTTNLGLGYRTRTSLQNQDAQLTLDYAGFNLSEVPTPVEDDRYIQNQVTVTVNDVSQTYSMTDGTLSTALPPAGVGIYGSDVALNLETTATATLRDQAAWRVHLGTVDEARFPSISVNLAHSSFVSNPALKQAVLGLRQGDRIVVRNPPAWLPPDDIEQVLLGFDETITHFEHRVTFTCAPASPYAVGVLDYTRSRVDTSGSKLLSAATSGATSIDVVPSSDISMLWTTDTAEVPWDIRVGGEVMTVTAVAPKVSDAFGRSVSNGWGSADSGQAWSTGGGTAADYAVGSGVGSHTIPTVNASRRTFIDFPYDDFDEYVSIAVSATATGNSISGGPTGRHYDSSNLYHARLEFTTTNTLILAIRRLLAGTETSLVSTTLADTYAPGTFLRIRFQGYGSTLRAKAWTVGNLEPPEWHVSTTDTGVTSAAFLGMRSATLTGNTNVSPQVQYDNFSVVSPQTFTVTRSVNGVVKAQVAGEDVRLAYPTTIAL